MRRLLLPAALLFSGCAASSPWKRANCERFELKKINFAVCSDVTVGQHCAQGALDDKTGKPVWYHPRACHISHPGRKSTIFLGRSYQGCVFHELCHEERPNNPAYCEEHFKCAGDEPIPAQQGPTAGSYPSDESGHWNRRR